jgi:FAD:protein FMN transferase
MRAELMGTTAEVIVTGDRALEPWGLDRLRELERRWSRFDADSEISTVNRAGGHRLPISHDTHVVLAAALDAWASTGGLFDPTVHDAMVAAGYDRTFAEVPRVGPATAPVAAPGCTGIELLPDSVRVPAGVRVDVGGIGKGVAADMVVEELLDRGARGACVNVGGDLRAAGRGPTPDGWIVAVADPFYRERQVMRVALDDGAVATSSRIGRRWWRAGRPIHHIVHPATGRSVESRVAATTVIAGRAAAAEVLAKLVFLDEARGVAALRDARASAIVIGIDRSVECIGDVDAFAA